MAYGYTGTMRTKPGRRDEVTAILLSGVDGLRSAGCQLYVVAFPADDPDLIHVNEVWDSKERHDASLQLPETRAAIGRAMPLLTGDFTSQELMVAGGLGVTRPLESNGFPEGTGDEVELYLRWLGFLRGAVLRKAAGLTDEQARWHPEGKLLPLAGIVNHLTGVETRWIDGAMLGLPTEKPADEYAPGADLTIGAAVEAYRRRAEKTDATVRDIADLNTPARDGGKDADLRFVLLHLINETGRHAGHADATRELLDGLTGE